MPWKTLIVFILFLLAPFFYFAAKILAINFSQPDQISTISSTVFNVFDSAVDKNGKVYVVDKNNSQVEKYDVGTSSWTVIGTYGTGVGFFNSPEGIAVDNNNNVYVADTGNDRIQIYNVGTTTWTAMGSYGGAVGKFFQPTGIAVDANNNIFVADNGNSRIQKYDSGSTSWSIISSSGAGAGQVNSPEGIDIGDSGNIYVADKGNSRIQIYDVGTTTWTTMGSSGAGLGAFLEPMGIAVDSAGNIFVADGGQNRLQKYDIGTTTWSAIGSLGTGTGQFDYPTRIKIDSSNNIYVTDVNNYRLQKYDAGMSSWSVLVSTGNGIGNVLHPHNVAVDNSGNVYVTDVYNNRIQIYNVGTSSWSSVGSFGAGANQLDQPEGIAVGSSGNIYIADTINNRIQIYNVGTTSWLSIGSSSELNLPEDVAVDNSGNIYVADTYNNRIQKYDVGTTAWTVISSSGFNRPEGIDLDNSGNIYVADSNNNQIRIYNVGTTSWTNMGVAGTGVGGFDKPSGIDVDGSGNIYVADSNNNRVQRYDVGTTSWSAVGQFNQPEGIAVDNNNTVYVADSNNNRIQKITYSNHVPGAPSGLQVTAGDGQVALTWIAPVDNGGAAITDYQIEYQATVGGAWTVFADGVSVNAGGMVTDLVNGTSYDFRVFAINSVGMGSASNIVTSTPMAAPTSTPTVGTTAAPPSSPANLIGYPGDTQVILSWTGPSDVGSSIVSYQIQYKLSTGSTWTIINTGSDSVSATVNGLANDISYDFRVSAVNQTGLGSPSAVLTTSPIAAPTPTSTIGTTVAPPSAPTNLTGIPGDTQVILSWTGPTADIGSSIVAYQVEYKLSVGGTWTVFGSGSTDFSSATVIGLTNGLSYDFRVSAVNQTGLGTPSSVFTTTPSATPSPTPTGVGMTSDISVLTTTISKAQALYDSAVEGSSNGQFQIGSKSTLLSAINAASAIDNTYLQATVNIGVSNLNGAINTFLANKILPSEIGSTNVTDLITYGTFVIPVGSSASQTPKVTIANNITIDVGDTSVLNSVYLPKDVEITEKDSLPFNANQISAMIIDKSAVSNFSSDFSPVASVQWGIPGVTLNFSQAITLNIYVGTGYNGQTLSVVRSSSLNSGWTSTGIAAPATCVVSNGVCQFLATSASYYTVLSYSPSQSNSSNNNSSSGPPGPPACTDTPPTINPDLFEIRTKKGSAQLFYTPSNSQVTGYAVLYGFKKGDERFGAITSTLNGNNGVQNFTINALEPKKTYYFEVAAINGCTISPWSEWVPVQANKNKTIYKYKIIIKNKIRTLISLFKK